MTMKEIRSMVCKKANALVKQGFSKSVAFKMAWASAKVAANSIKAANLTSGDCICIEYGDYGNSFNCTVTEVSNTLFLGKYLIIKALAPSGNIVEFTSKPDELIRKAA